MREIETPHGTARAHLQLAEAPAAALVMGHGAGGGVGSPDLVAVADAARAAGVSVALVEQPYRVAGKRAPAPARQLDGAWTTVIEELAASDFAGLPLITGGRSLGARVACRTVDACNASAVLCLAFPLLPPARKNATSAPQSRLAELDAVSVPVLVVQGTSDRFGMPPPGKGRTVVQVAGDHGLKSDVEAVAAAAGQWLRALPKAP